MSGQIHAEAGNIAGKREFARLDVPGLDRAGFGPAGTDIDGTDVIAAILAQEGRHPPYLPAESGSYSLR